MRLRLTLSCLALLLPAAAAAPASAEAISIEVDQNIAVTIPSAPGAVVIGNPTIADVTIQGDKMFILGRSFGTTNVMILDQNGEEITHLDVSVKHVTDNAVTVFTTSGIYAEGAVRMSFNCAPLCESEYQVGDEVGYNGTIGGQIKEKIKLATGQEDAKSEAPPAPQ